MKKNILILLSIILLTASCSEDNDETATPVAISFTFSHTWDEAVVNKSSLSNTMFVNENGESLTITRLRYLISDIVLTHKNGGTITLDNYQLVDLSDEDSFSFTTTEDIIPGEYSKVTFRFGFKNSDNVDGVYQDLNAASFNVPQMLGGGYHFMQMDGNFTDSQNTTQPFNFHAIRAYNDSDPNNIIITDTSFSVNIGSVNVGANTKVNINMDIAEWFYSPNLWDLNTASVNLMGNAAAQIAISQNGSSVFSLISIEK